MTAQSLLTQDARVAPRSLGRFLPSFILLSVLLATAGVRLRLLHLPLERDEGEYAYAGQLLLHGIPPYSLACNMKWPGTYYSYALIEGIFGETLEGVRAGMIFVSAGGILLTYFLARRFLSAKGALAAAGAFALLSTGVPTLGFAGHATHFVLLPALGGTILLLRALQSCRAFTFFMAGVVLGFAPIMKQPGILFIAFAILWCIYQGWRNPGLPKWRLIFNTALLTVGSALPAAAMCLVLWRSGVFPAFWFWTVTYGREYAMQIPLSMVPYVFFSSIKVIVLPSVFLWCVAFLGLILLVTDRVARRHAPFILGFLLFSFLAVSAGFHFRTHYFILILPAVALLVGMTLDTKWFSETSAESLSKTSDRFYQALPIVVFIFACGGALYTQFNFFFRLNMQEASRAAYGSNPFPESTEIARYLESHTTPADRIAILGSEPQIYFYTHRLSASGYIYMYNLMELHPYALQMQKEMIADIEKAAPKYILYVNVDSSWLRQDDSEMAVFAWFKEYSSNYLIPVAQIDIKPEGTEYHWAAEEGGHVPSPQSEYSLTLYRRK